MLKATPVMKRKPAIAQTEVPNAVVNLSNRPRQHAAEKHRDEQHGIEHVDDISKAALRQRVINRTTIRRLVNESAKCRRHFIRVRAHVTLV